MAEPVSTILGVKLSIAQGAVAGSLVAVILGEGTTAKRVFHAAGGALVSVYGTEGALELLGRWITITDATNRLGGLLFGIVGIVLAQALTKGANRAKDRAPDVVDGVIERKRVVVVKETTTTKPAEVPTAPAPDSAEGPAS